MSEPASPPWFLRFLLLVALLVALAALIAEITGSKPQPVLEPFQPGFIPDPLEQLPDIGEITHVPWRKEAFFTALVPLVVYENERIAWQRSQLEKAKAALEQDIALLEEDEQLLKAIFAHYRVDWPADQEAWELILKRAWPVPEDLVLMQGAKESGWGTSRFAVEGNNLFGQWCFSQGCGLVPERRTPDRHHEVRLFATVQESVRSYLRNINTHRAYRELRELRQALIAEDAQPSGSDLAPGLISYSERRQAYVDEVLHLLHSNQQEILQALDAYYLQLTDATGGE